MRICFVSRRFFPAISGMSVYAANLLRELVRMGHDVTMVSQYRGDEEGTRVYGGGPPPEVPGVRVIGLEAVGEQNGGNFEKDVEALAQNVVEEHERAPFDVIHAQYGYPTGLAALVASRRTGVPNLVSIQGGDGHWVGTCCATHKRAMLAVLNHAGALLIGSRSFAAEVTGNHDTPPDRFTIVPGAVNTDRFTPDPASPGSLSDPPVLLYHGRVDRRKGALDLLEAVAALREKLPLQLIVSGIGPDSDAVAERVVELGLTESVELSGYADYPEVPAVYRRGDVFVSPTYAEGFSNTILEAMATGLPVVSTRAVGVVDCLSHGENGLLHEPGDVDGLVAALERMLGDDVLRRRLAEKALEEARTLYSWPAVAGQIVGVYESLLNTEPDDAWTDPGPAEPCRFRLQPHLL
ncbi:MAG: glycosyltransferase family 4 protein [Rubrobacteraceae bacterium]